MPLAKVGYEKQKRFDIAEGVRAHSIQTRARKVNILMYVRDARNLEKQKNNKSGRYSVAFFTLKCLILARFTAQLFLVGSFEFSLKEPPRDFPTYSLPHKR